MPSGSNDQLDEIKTLIASFIAASVSDRQASSERMERYARESNERMTRLEESMEQFQALVETSYEPVQALLEASTQNQAMIERLDAIIERMVYREGRGGDEKEQ